MIIRRVLISSVLFLSLPVWSAEADIIKVDFTGTASGIRPFYEVTGGYDLGNFSGVSFVGRMMFDSQAGAISVRDGGLFWLIGGLLSAGLHLEGMGDYAVPVPTNSRLIWGPDGTVYDADAGGGYFHLSLGSFQFGLCPSTAAPCGSLGSQTETFTNVTEPGFNPPLHSPLPLVGSGLPGLLALLFGGFFLRGYSRNIGEWDFYFSWRRGRMMRRRSPQGWQYRHLTEEEESRYIELSAW